MPSAHPACHACGRSRRTFGGQSRENFSFAFNSLRFLQLTWEVPKIWQGTVQQVSARQKTFKICRQPATVQHALPLLARQYCWRSNRCWKANSRNVDGTAFRHVLEVSPSEGLISPSSLGEFLKACWALASLAVENQARVWL